MGLTVFNGNDFLQDWCWTSGTEADLAELVDEATKRTVSGCTFLVNDPAFFPDLRPELYPALITQTQEYLRSKGAEVDTGSHYLTKVKRSDAMHFAVESTKPVAEMVVAPLLVRLQGAEQRMDMPVRCVQRVIGRHIRSQ